MENMGVRNVVTLHCQKDADNSEDCHPEVNVSVNVNVLETKLLTL